jgi:nitrogen fixation/metabolism regulation signal transduction histidine kinase
MEDHSGKIVLTNNEDGGATINLLFHQKDNKEESETKQVTLNNVS